MDLELLYISKMFTIRFATNKFNLWYQCSVTRTLKRLHYEKFSLTTQIHWHFPSPFYNSPTFPGFQKKVVTKLIFYQCN